MMFSGKVEKRNYTKGELHGPATITWQTGDVFEFSYKNGNMELLHRLRRYIYLYSLF